MKKICLLLVIGLFILTGCFGSSSKYSKPVDLTYKKYSQKLDKKESFVMLIWRTGCSHCEDFEPKLNEVIKEYDLTIYSINTEDLLESEYAKLQNKTFMSGTPTLVVFENGKYKTKLVGDKDKSEVVNFLKQNKYIR